MKNITIASILISVSMSIVIFTGCSNPPKVPNSENLPTQIKPPMNNTTKSNQSNSTAMMKTLYSNALKDLVTAKTITQTESDKVLKELTMDMSQVKGVKGNINKLSALVKSHVITQAQADKINQRIQNGINKIK